MHSTAGVCSWQQINAVAALMLGFRLSNNGSYKTITGQQLQDTGDIEFVQDVSVAPYGWAGLARQAQQLGLSSHTKGLLGGDEELIERMHGDQPEREDSNGNLS